MRPDKQQAIQLRKQGKSYQEIVNIIGVPKSTLSNWFSGVNWSDKTRQRLSELAKIGASRRMTVISHRKRDELKKNYQKQGIVAGKQFKNYIRERLFVAGLAVYWGEGDNKLEDGIIRVANSDPLMIKLFCQFLKKYLPEISSKAKMYLVLYPDLDDEVCRQHWSSQIGIPLSRFIKSSFIKGKCPTKRLRYGIGTVTISNRLYKEHLMTWVNLFKKENIAGIV